MTLRRELFPREASPSPPRRPGPGAPDWKPALWIFCAALLAVSTMAFRGVSCGHDLNFHLLSWMEAARAWHSGVVYPHWVDNANYGAGEPRMIFYPPASWLLGAALGTLASWAAAPALFVLVVLSGCGWSMYRLAREWLPAEIAALSACLYLSNPYMLFDVYERSAFGELLAGVWIPLIVLFALRRSSSAGALGLAVAAVWLTNAPAAVLASYMLGVLALSLAVAEGEAWPVLRAAGGMAWGLGLASFYLVPAAYERRWVEIERAFAGGLNIEGSFLFGQKGDSLHNQVLRTASWIMVLEVGVAAAALWRCRRDRGPGAKVRAIFAFLLPLILLLQFPVSDLVWTHAPQLSFIQFPWRWLLVVSVAACLLAGMAIAHTTAKASNSALRGQRASRRWRVGAAALLISGMAIGAANLFFAPGDGPDTVAAQIAAFRLGHGVEGTDEYTPAAADNSAIQQGLPLVRVLAHSQDDSIDSSRVENPPWRASANTTLASSIQVQRKNAEDWAIQIEAEAPAYAVMRLMDYPAWDVTSNGVPTRTRPHRGDGLMTIPLSRGKNTIVVRWRNTPDVLVGRAISATALVLLLAVFGGRWRTKVGKAAESTARSAVERAEAQTIRQPLVQNQPSSV